MKLIFAGTPDFAAQHLAALLATEHQIVAVYTQPDRPAGRGKKLAASPVKTLAQAHDIPVIQPENFKSAADISQLKQFAADLMIVVAYGIILPKEVLAAPHHGCLNVHGSILPRWRGAAPIQRAIWAGDEQSGVTIMQMDEGLDTGAILAIESCPISTEETSASLYNKLAQLGPKALIKTLDQYHTLSAEPQQDALANYAKKLSKQEAQIDWQLSAAQLARNVRAFNPWPMAFIRHQGDNLKVFRASVSANSLASKPGTVLQANEDGLVVACGQDALVIHELQLPGKKPQPIGVILNGHSARFAVGKVLTEGDNE